MKTEIWKIENGLLVCYYETYNGHKGAKAFKLCATRDFLGQTEYDFKEDGTKYYMSCVRWCNLTKSYTPLYNNTKFSAFIKADITTII